jgi:hypothetical protein
VTNFIGANPETWQNNGLQHLWFPTELWAS